MPGRRALDRIDKELEEKVSQATITVPKNQIEILQHELLHCNQIIRNQHAELLMLYRRLHNAGGTSAPDSL